MYMYFVLLNMCMWGGGDGGCVCYICREIYRCIVYGMVWYGNNLFGITEMHNKLL